LVLAIMSAVFAARPQLLRLDGAFTAFSPGAQRRHRSPASRPGPLGPTRPGGNDFSVLACPSWAWASLQWYLGKSSRSGSDPVVATTRDGTRVAVAARLAAADYGRARGVRATVMVGVTFCRAPAPGGPFAVAGAGGAVGGTVGPVGFLIGAAVPFGAVFTRLLRGRAGRDYRWVSGRRTHCSWG